MYFLFVCLVVFRLAVAEIFGVVTKVRTFEDVGVEGNDNIDVDFNFLAPTIHINHKNILIQVSMLMLISYIFLQSTCTSGRCTSFKYS